MNNNIPNNNIIIIMVGTRFYLEYREDGFEVEKAGRSHQNHKEPQL